MLQMLWLSNLEFLWRRPEASRTRIGGMWVGARARDSLPLDGKKTTRTSHKWRSNGERFQARVKCVNSGGAYLPVKII